MKIAAWNVNGIRANVKKGAFFEYLNGANAPDILGIQETKAKKEQLSDEILYPENYYTYWNEAEKKGYSGVAIFTRIKPIEVKYGFEHKDFINPYHNTEGRIISAEFESFILFTVYFPNGGKNPKHFEYKFKFYKYLFEYINNLHKEKKKPIIINGDFNIAHTELDIARPKSNEKSIGFTIAERKLLDKIESAGFVDTFRNLYPESKEYSWWHFISKARERNVGWRIDYNYITNDLLEKVIDARILGHIMGSDHCPVELTIECNEDKSLNKKVIHKDCKTDTHTLF